MDSTSHWLERRCCCLLPFPPYAVLFCLTHPPHAPIYLHDYRQHARAPALQTTYMKVRKFPCLVPKGAAVLPTLLRKDGTRRALHFVASTTLQEVVAFLVSDIRGQILRCIPMFGELDGTQLAQLLTILKPLQRSWEPHSNNGRERT